MRRLRAGHGHGHGDVSADEAGARQDARGRRQVEGTAILTDMQDGIGAARHREPDQRRAPAPAEEPKKKGLGGMIGGLEEDGRGVGEEQQRQKPERAIIMTTSVEMLKLTTDVDAASVATARGIYRETK